LKHKEILVACWVCQKPHAKRKCPAANSYICSLCCGNKRKREINCPDDCDYLVQAQNGWIQKLQISPHQIDYWQSHFDIIHNIGLAALQVKRTRFSDLKGIEIKEALENLIKTYETEERGIIYEYKSSNYRIQSIFDNIQKIINQHRNIAFSNLQSSIKTVPERKLRKVKLDEVIAVLKFVLGLVKQCINKDTGNTAYFDFINHFTNNTLIEATD